MKANEAKEFGLYDIPSRELKKAEFIGKTIFLTFEWCKFLTFNQYRERKIIMVPSDTQIEESK